MNELKKVAESKYCPLLVLGLMLLSVGNSENISESPRLFLNDALASERLATGEVSKKNHGGKFSDRGWRSLQEDGYLKIELKDADSLGGILEVDLVGLDWEQANRSSGINRKIHFLNMFSNTLGDHHVEDGGTADDALWTLRIGSDKQGNPRYGQSFKILWASNGAKRSDGSDYHEKKARIDDNFAWPSRVRIRVQWCLDNRFLKVWVDDLLCAELPWENQISPLRYVFLGKSKDFHPLRGVYFRNLKIYR